MKLKAMKILSVLTFVFVIASINHLSYAQDIPADKALPNHQGWYQVEMIIFSRTNPALQEHFPTNIQLHYPVLFQTLKDPKAVDTGNQTHSAAGNLLADNTPAPAIDLNSQPFYQLPQEMRQLNYQANKMAGSSEYQLLFHEAWRQPINNKSQADWILINAEKKPASQLSGAIRLSVATYLVLETNLWFAEFEPKLDDNESIWPDLPERPDLIAKETLSSQNDTNNQEFIEETLEPPNTVQTKRVVLLKSKREMRSNEVHYIDHPLVGIVIKITQFKPVEKPIDIIP